MTAKEKIAQERKKQRELEETQGRTSSTNAETSEMPKKNIKFENKKSEEENYPKERHFEHKAYLPNERPMTLSQMQYMAPKKFKPQRQRPNVNLEEVRNLINKNTQNNKVDPKHSDEEDYDLDRRETGK